MKPLNPCILLISNYLLDQQHSMLRFAELIEGELKKRHIVYKRIAPPCIFNRWESKRLPRLRKFSGYIDKYLIFPFILKWYAWRLSKNYKLCLHICDHSNAFYVPFIQKHAHLVTCHDCLAIQSAQGLFPENRVSPLGKLLQYRIVKGLKKAQKIICVSYSTAQQLQVACKIDSLKIQVIYLGNCFLGSNLPSQGERKKTSIHFNTITSEVSSFDHVLSKNYVLHIGGNQWYKNRLGVIAIYTELLKITHIRNLELIVVGEPLSLKLQADITRLNLVSNFIHLGSATDPILKQLYAHAQLLLFPSLEEGFGWPIIEAQACGCPVATTDKAPMTEIGGSSLILLPRAPVSDNNLFMKWAHESAECIEVFLQQPVNNQKTFKVKGFQNSSKFTLESMMDGYLKAYDNLL